MKLEDLNPQPATFTLSSTGKEYTLRKVTLADTAWMNTTFGDKLGGIFERCEMIEILRIVFHQLEDKSDFAARDVAMINDDGESVTIRKKGVELLMEAISGIKEQIAIVSALVKTIGISQPIPDLAQKKSIEITAPTQPTGDQSTTDLPPNTATHSEKLAG